MPRTKSISKSSELIAGKALSQKELGDMIKNAEKGPFFTLEESKKMFEEWRRKNYKL